MTIPSSPPEPGAPSTTTVAPALAGAALSWIALALGIVAVLIPGIPATTTEYFSGYGSLLLAFGAIPVAIIAVVLGAIALRQRSSARGAAIAGLLLGAAEIAVTVVMFVSYIAWSTALIGAAGI